MVKKFLENISVFLRNFIIFLLHCSSEATVTKLFSYQIAVDQPAILKYLNILNWHSHSSFIQVNDNVEDFVTTIISTSHANLSHNFVSTFFGTERNLCLPSYEWENRYQVFKMFWVYPLYFIYLSHELKHRACIWHIFIAEWTINKEM